jgi:hypothetical protein
MSELIAAKAKGELLERYEEERPPEDAEVTESEYVRSLLDDGLAAREQSFYERIGLSARLGAQLEAERRTGESKTDVVREVLKEGLQARDEDALDAIGASGDLREAVEESRKDGESLDGAVERLLLQGVDADPSGPPDLKDRATLAVAVTMLALTFVGVYAAYGPLAPAAAAVGVVGYVMSYPALDDAITRGLEVVRSG